MKPLFIRAMIAAAAIAGMSVPAHAADTSDAVSALLTAAQAQSSQLSLEWKSRAKQPAINQAGEASEFAAMKDDLAAIGHTVEALNAARTQASPAQLAAMDRIVPVVAEIAENAANAIDFLTKNQMRLTEKQYKDYVERSSDNSGRLAGLISQLVDYETRKARFEIAKRNLELAEK